MTNRLQKSEKIKIVKKLPKSWIFDSAHKQHFWPSVWVFKESMMKCMVLSKIQDFCNFLTIFIFLTFANDSSWKISPMYKFLTNLILKRRSYDSILSWNSGHFWPQNRPHVPKMLVFGAIASEKLDFRPSRVEKQFLDDGKRFLRQFWPYIWP